MEVVLRVRNEDAVGEEDGLGVEEEGKMDRGGKGHGGITNIWAQRLALGKQNTRRNLIIRLSLESGDTPRALIIWDFSRYIKITCLKCIVYVSVYGQYLNMIELSITPPLCPR